MPSETDELDAMSSLLSDVVDSFEKLEVVVYLYRQRFIAQRSSSIGVNLSLSPSTVAEVLAALLRAGVVRTHEHDGAGWWLDSKSPWATTIDVLVALYEIDRAELLGLMKRAGFEGLRLGDLVRRSQRTPRQPC